VFDVIGGDIQKRFGCVDTLHARADLKPNA
jgi:hypothetical protein